MVSFNELRIRRNRDRLIIDCSIDDITIYSGMYIKKVELYDYKNASSAGDPVDSQKVYTVYSNADDDASVQAIRKCVDIAAVSDAGIGISTFRNGIFFVRVTCDGTLPAEVSQYACGTDDVVATAVVPDWEALYFRGMDYIAGLSGCGKICDPSLEMQQFIITWFSIKLALEARDFDQLALMWERFLKFSQASSMPVSTPCGCH